MLTALLKTMRPKQWTKNVFVFGALVFDQKLFDLNAFFSALNGFILFCIISGAVYIINDIVDAEKDRLHPQKKFRPIASGEFNIRAAIISAILLPCIAIPFSFWLHALFGWLVSLYLVLQLAYSFRLKEIVIIDVLAIAAGFVIRVGAGAVLVEVARFSPWMYVCLTLLWLFLGFGKRRQELVLLKGDAKQTRVTLDDYSIQLLDQIIAVVAASTIMAYALYTFSAPQLPDNNAMMLTIPYVIYGIFRYFFVIHIGNGGDPSEVLLEDRPLQLTIVLWGLTVVVILYWEFIQDFLMFGRT